MAQAMTQNETIDLPNATIQDGFFGEETGSHFVTVETEEENPELSYIIGQFQSRGYELNGIDFKRNTVTFAREA